MKLLLVEDDRDLSRAMVRVLEYNKYNVDTAFDGIEGLKFLEQNKYDAVIMDIMMPRLDGISAIKQIRLDGNNVPIIILSAKSEIDDKVNGLDAGADDYLTKPFVIKELLARIRALTRRSGAIIEAYSIGDLNLDSNTFELTYNKNSIRLTNKEFKIMELLIRNKNALMSTEKIMESVWEIDSGAEINVVWVFISALRKKLETINANYIIKAVRGVGYRLEEKTNYSEV